MSDSKGFSWRAFIVRVFAFVLLLLVPGYFIYRPLNYHNYLYDTYFEAFPNYEDKQQADALKKEGLAAYETLDFGVASTKLSAYRETHPKDYTAVFYLGMAYLQDGDSDLAIPCLEEVIATDSTNFTQAAAWYITLAHIKSNDIETATPLLEVIANSNGDYKQKAVELLKKMG